MRRGEERFVKEKRTDGMEAEKRVKKHATFREGLDVKKKKRKVPTHDEECEDGGETLDKTLERLGGEMNVGSGVCCKKVDAKDVSGSMLDVL